jgi:hypothetical protein
VGLFIDEVGKFITSTNDYFYQPAAPIIYGFFLLTVLVYLRVRRSPPRHDARNELYHSLDGLEEVLDHDLSDQERSELEARLSWVAKSGEEDDFSRLAAVLLDFVRSDAVTIVNAGPTIWSKALERTDRWVDRHLGRGTLRALLALGLVTIGVLWLANLGFWLLALFASVSGRVASILLYFAGSIPNPVGREWYLLRVVLEGVVGVFLLVAARDMVLRHERRGLEYGLFALLLSLTTVSLLVFYFDQFRALTGALVQFGLVMGLIYYRRRYVV